jgi:4'-phosphopantetheinyl transferase
VADSQMLPTSRLTCGASEIHVWRIVLDRTPEELRTLGAVLCPDERLRASRFATEQLRHRWTAARGALRIILAAYLDTTPEALVIAADANGKPQLAGTGASHFFNMTHTDYLAFAAVSVQGAVGIDAEIERPDIDWYGIGRRFFAPAEIDEIVSLPPEMRLRGFYACWSRKEAYLKALGIGLSGALDKFQVTVRPDQAAALSWVAGSATEPRHWSFWDLSEPGVAVTLATRTSARLIRRFSFPPRGESSG